MLDQLGLEARFYRGDSKRQLQQQIEIIHGVQHKKVVCVLDEAHLLWIYQCAESACPVFWKSPVRKEEIMVSDR